jgi:hypothetical protein
MYPLLLRTLNEEPILPQTGTGRLDRLIPRHELKPQHLFRLLVATPDRSIQLAS